VSLICPAHCTREKERLLRMYPGSAVKAGVGRVLEIWGSGISLITGQPFIETMDLSPLRFHHKCNGDQNDQGDSNMYCNSIIIMGTVKISRTEGSSE
jgi:hypothetical protein